MTQWMELIIIASSIECVEVGTSQLPLSTSLSRSLAYESTI